MSRRGGVQATDDVIRVGENLFADKSGAIQVRIGRCRNSLDREAVCRRRRPLRSLKCAWIGSLSPCCRRKQKYEQSCFLHVTSGKDRAWRPLPQLMPEKKGFSRKVTSR